MKITGDNNIKKMLLVMTLICAWLFISSADSGADLEWPKTHVKLFNKAWSKSDMVVHCWSSEDDLGFHTIKFGQYYEFSFRHNVWCNTKFVCMVKFGDGGEKFFYGYHCQRDVDHCGRMCEWSLYETAACRWNSFCYGYDDKPPSNDVTKTMKIMADNNIKKTLLITTLNICLWLSICSAESGADFEWPITHVKLFNKAESQSDMIGHCWSSDDNLGSRITKFDEYYGFPTQFLKFVCMVKFGSGDRKFFYGYHRQSDAGKCGRKCEWSLYENRACRWDIDCYEYTDKPPDL
uniref:S-protein homolog n=1 Tax=Kalanchoe fedtschenkoi TaxID=63787 RepID=A0A7N0ZTL8_KALFE